MLKSKSQKKSGLMLAVLHLVLVLHAYQVNVEQGTDYYSGLLWLLLLFIDYPISLGIQLFDLQRPGDNTWNNQLMPLLYLGTLGTLWWFFLGIIFRTFATFCYRLIMKIFRH